MALLHDQLAALVWAADNECILDVVYRRFGLTPDFLFITANDLRQFLTITPALTDDLLEERAAVLNTLFRNIPEDQRQGFLENALLGDLGQAARALPDDELKLAWFEDMLQSYDPNLPDGQQLVDAFFDNPELVKAWKVLHPRLTRKSKKYLNLFSDDRAIAARKNLLDHPIKDFEADFPYLSQEEITAIHLYTTRAYRGLNSALRGTDPMSDFHRSFKTVLEEALEKMPKYTGPYFRGTSVPKSVLEKYLAALPPNSGKTYSDKAFSSTSSVDTWLGVFQNLTQQPGEIKIIVTGTSGSRRKLLIV